MALKGFLSTDNYTVVVINDYDKKEKRLTFDATTYADATKTSVISESAYDVSVDMARCSSVISKDITSIPADAAEGSRYIVGDCSDSPLSGVIGAIATRGTTNNDWTIESKADGACVHVIDEDAYYVRKDGSWILSDANDMTPARWDELFNPNLFDAANANLMQAIYDYLKTTDEFSHTVDA